MTGSLKAKGFKIIKETLNKHGLAFSVSVNLYANQFLETGNYSPKAMETFLKVAFDLINNELAEELSNNLITLVKQEVGK